MDLNWEFCKEVKIQRTDCLKTCLSITPENFRNDLMEPDAFRGCRKGPVV